MQPATTRERPLPRQVQQRADAARALETDGNPSPEALEQPTATAPTAPVQNSYLLEAPTPEKDGSLEYWKARASTIEGLRRKQSIDFERRLKELGDEVADLRLKLLDKKTAEPVTPPVITDDEVKAYFTAEQIQELGMPHLKAILASTRAEAQRAATAEVRSAVAPAEEKRRKQEEIEAQTAHTAFLAKVSEIVPNWESIQKDPRFSPWMEEPDPATGIRRQTLILQYQQSRDAPRAAWFFEEFLKHIGAVKIDPPQVTPPESGARGEQGRTQPDPANMPVEVSGFRVTKQSIRTFYKEKATKPYYRTPDGIARAKVIEAAIEAASRSGQPIPAV